VGGVHEERLSQGRLPQGAWESPVELYEDCEPPGVILEMLFQQPPGHTLVQPETPEHRLDCPTHPSVGLCCVLV